MVNRRIIDQTEALSLSGDDYLIVDNTNLGTRKIQFTRLLSGATPLPPNYLTGFEITKNSDTSFSVSTGYARSMDNVRNIVLNNSLVKDLSLTFDLGNAGCMPDSLTLQANKKYYIFAISTSGGQTDIIVDTDENCSNGLADNVVALNNFDKFAKIGYLTTDANPNILKIESYDMYDMITNKANTDMNNITSSGKETVVGWGIPDYSTVIAKASGSSAPSKGWAISYGLNANVYMKVNDVQVAQGNWSHNSWSGNWNMQIMVDAGDIVTGANWFFIAMKGVN